MNDRKFKMFNECIKKIIYLLGLFKINFDTLILDEDIRKLVELKVNVQQKHRERVLLEKDSLQK